ncbi:MAG TPA: ribokinase [Acholeplasmataceae bacterium]|nr:ribokinase [Acholeplasmataceae bacterium]
MKKVFILGSLNMDMVIESPVLPEKGETVKGSGFMMNPGGKGANQAVACARLGGVVKMAGCVGGDLFGKDLIKTLNEAGVDTSSIRTVTASPTGVAVILIIDRDNRIIIDEGANARVIEEDVDNLLSEAGEGDIFLTQLENPVKIIGYALKKAKEKGLYTILNPAPANLEIIEYLPYVDLFIPNETEFMVFTGDDDLENSGKKIFSLGAKELVVTLGSKGYCHLYREGIEYGSCPKVEAVDTTAAGDTFCGALAAELSIGSALKDALRFATKAASIAVTAKGAQSSIPDRKKVESFKF